MDTNQKLKAPGLIQPGLYIGNHAVILTDQKTVEPVNHRSTDDQGQDRPLGDRKWIEWGDRDTYPDVIEELNSQEPISSRCLDFKAKALIGQGLYWFRKRLENGKEIHEPVDIDNDPALVEIRDFCQASAIDEQLRDLAMDFEWWNLCHTELIRNVAGTKFVSMRRIDTTYCRATPRDNRGHVPGVYVSSRFGQNNRPLDKDILPPIPCILPDDPLKFRKAILRHYRSSSRRLYYPKPSWHSTFGTLDLALEAFKWIRSNLKNSKNIKYLVKVPWNYFLSRFKIEDYNNDRAAWLNAIAEDEKRLYNEMDQMLGGAENAMKSFRTKYGTMDDGTVVEEFKIESISVDTQHDAWLPLYATTTAAICSGHGVSPVLASIIISSTMGASHGSTIREYFNFYTQFETTIPRQVVLEPLLLVKKVNKWPADIYPGFRNIILETLDHNPTGTRTEGEANPTSPNKTV